MVQESNEALIAEARQRRTDLPTQTSDGPLIDRLTDALEAAEDISYLADAASGLTSRAIQLEDQRDALAAVVEKVRERNALDLDTEDDDSEFHQGIRHAASNMSDILAAASTDALAERDAEKWDEGHHAGLRQADYEYGAAGFQVVKPNPYRREEQS